MIQGLLKNGDRVIYSRIKAGGNYETSTHWMCYENEPGTVIIHKGGTITVKFDCDGKTKIPTLKNLFLITKKHHLLTKIFT